MVKTIRLRKDGQPDRRYEGKSRRRITEPYTADRHGRWRELQRPNPEHLKKLRDGIIEFRQMLDMRGPRDEYSVKMSAAQ